MRKHLQGRGHPPALLFLAAVFAAAAWPTRHASGASPAANRGICVQRAPVAFRMDGMHVDVRGQQLSGEGNVVVRQDSWLVCCDHFEASTDPHTSKKIYVCWGRVRGSFDGRLLWADRAEYSPENHLLTLTGRPRIAQGAQEGRIEGLKMVVDTERRQVHIHKPQGFVRPKAAAAPTQADPNQPPQDEDGPLPNSCPFAWVTP